MNKKGILKGLLILILVAFIILLYHYTEPTKEIVGMAVATWEPINLNLEQKELTFRFSDLENITQNITKDLQNITDKT